MKKEIFIAINIYNNDIKDLKVCNTKSAAIRYLLKLCKKNQKMTNENEKDFIEIMNEEVHKNEYSCYAATLFDLYTIHYRTITI